MTKLRATKLDPGKPDIAEIMATEQIKVWCKKLNFYWKLVLEPDESDFSKIKMERNGVDLTTIYYHHN